VKSTIDCSSSRPSSSEMLLSPGASPWSGVAAALTSPPPLAA
jgi:hypothetical protein